MTGAQARPAADLTPSPADPGLAGLLAGWLPKQRWFAGKGGPDSPDGPDDADGSDDGSAGAPARSLRLHAALPLSPVATLYLVADGPVLYQVPLTRYPDRRLELEHALVGVLPVTDGTEPGRHWVYDGPHDPAFVRPWLQLIAGGRAEHAGVVAQGVVAPGGPPIDPGASSTVLRGEQSNTSVIVGQDGPNPLMVKLFRVVSAGENPDVAVALALSGAGSLRVPAPAGWIEADWVEPLAGSSVARGHWAFAAQFLPGSQDAWRVAVEAVADGTSFASEALDLGAALAQVHLCLATALPTRRADPHVLAELADGLLARVGWAVGQAPELAPFESAARAVMDAVRGVSGAPDLQRVHGDCHLGQVLHSPSRGWVFLDFEGEPLRPMAERSAPDLALRDVAGMLRSFDYAARHATVDLPADDPGHARSQAWADQARQAFLAGYAQESARDPRTDAVLLRALELDKALYEVVYEVRNRPSWAVIPMAAVHRLLPQP